MLFAGYNVEFDLVCKYFSGAKDNRFGDIQSLRPVSQIPESVPGIFTVFEQNKFANFSLDDNYVLLRLLSFAPMARGCAQNSQVGAGFAGDVYSTEYRLFVFTICVNEIWHLQGFSFCADDPGLCAKLTDGNSGYSQISEQPLRRLAVMAFYLIEKLNNTKEKDPQEGESFKKLFDTFSSELYSTLTAGVLNEASPLLKLLTICALKLSINIPAYREV